MVHARNFARVVPGARLVGLADKDETLRGERAAELGVEAAEAAAFFCDGKADAAVIATPTRFHAEVAIAAMEAGLHVLCEKPMAMTPSECERMAQAAESAGVILQVGFMRRFDAGFCEVAERLEGGEIGRSVSIRSLTYGPSIPKPWMYDIGSSNGPLAEVNSHDIDTLFWYANSEAEEVFAVAGNYRCDDARESHPDFYDNVTMTVRFANGAQGLVQGAQGVRYGYDARCEVLGESGLLTVGALPDGSVRSHTPAGRTNRIVSSWRDLFREAYVAEDVDFVDCIRSGRAPRAGAKEGLQALRVVLAGNRSIRERRPVRLEDIQREN